MEKLLKKTKKIIGDYVYEELYKAKQKLQSAREFARVEKERADNLKAQLASAEEYQRRRGDELQTDNVALKERIRLLNINIQALTKALDESERARAQAEESLKMIAGEGKLA